MPGPMLIDKVLLLSQQGRISAQATFNLACRVVQHDCWCYHADQCKFLRQAIAVSHDMQVF